MRIIIKIFGILVFIASSVSMAYSQSNCVPPANCGLSSTEIEAYPEPDIIPVIIEDDVLYDRRYRKLIGNLQIYDAPNGNLVNDFGEGYNYVTVMEEADGWAKINDDQWVKIEILGDEILPSRFAGVQLPEAPLPYTMAWTLRHLRASKTPGADSSDDNPYMYRYTRVNIYTSVEVDGYLWYQIGEDEWVHQFDVAKIIPTEKPEGVDTHKWVSVDLYEQVAIAYEDDRPVFATLVSSGLSAWSTNEGIFHVYLRFPRTLMSGAYSQPDFYYLEEVPWTMYFDDDIALHGTYWHDGFGYRQSHGCVNLSITDAYWLFNWADDEFDFANEDYEGPAVYVYSSGDYD